MLSGVPFSSARGVHARRAAWRQVRRRLAAPPARSPHGSTLTAGLLMAAPFGVVIGAFLLGRIAASPARVKMMA